MSGLFANNAELQRLKVIFARLVERFRVPPMPKRVVVPILKGSG